MDKNDGGCSTVQLKDRRANKTRRNADLVNRLGSCEVNENTPEDKLEYSIDTPSIADYRDVHSDTDLPVVTMDTVDRYLQDFGIEIEEDVKRSYKECCLVYVRSAVKDNQYYLLAHYTANIKGNVSYNIDVVIDRGGVIVECQCECHVGIGPHASCKHVQCLLFGVVCFSEHRHFTTQYTVNQSYQGSPVKLCDLPWYDENERSESERLLAFDPRPENCRLQTEFYQANFRNMCINFQANNSVRGSGGVMPIMQCFPPANPYAICHDHDYLKGRPQDLFLQALSVSNISGEEIARIELKTRGESNLRKWRFERLKRITAANFGRVCKCTENTNKRFLAESFMAIGPKVYTKSVQYNRTARDVAIEKFEKDNGVVCEPCGIFVSETFPYLSCAPDAVIDESTILKVKCPYANRNKLINEHSIHYLKRVDGQLILDQKYDYYYQIQGELFCSNRRVCKFIIYTLKDTVTLTVNRDNKFINAMNSQLKDFYDDYFREAFLKEHLFRDYYSYKFEYE